MARDFCQETWKTDAPFSVTDQQACHHTDPEQVRVVTTGFYLTDCLLLPSNKYGFVPHRFWPVQVRKKSNSSVLPLYVISHQYSNGQEDKETQQVHEPKPSITSPDCSLLLINEASHSFINWNRFPEICFPPCSFTDSYDYADLSLTRVIIMLPYYTRTVLVQSFFKHCFTDWPIPPALAAQLPCPPCRASQKKVDGDLKGEEGEGWETGKCGGFKPEPFIWRYPTVHFLLLGLVFKALKPMHMINKDTQIYEKFLEHRSDLQKLKQITAKVNSWLSWDKRYNSQSEQLVILR